MTNLNLPARDIVISRANELPTDLLISTVDEKCCLFTTDLLFRLTEVQLYSLRQEAKKLNFKKLNDEEGFFLIFYSILEKNLNKELPQELKDFDTFDFSKVSEIIFNGSTAPHQGHADDSPMHYVSVTLVLKD